MCVTCGRLDLENPLFDGQERNIKSSTSQIENEYVPLAFGFLVKTIGDSCRGGLVDNTEDIQPGNKTGIFCGLTLRVVEVGWDSDDSVVDCSSEI